MYDFVMPFIIQMVSEMKSRDNEIKKEKESKEKEKVTTTTLDFVSHDLEMMMPGSQLMLTGGAPAYQSVGGLPPIGGSMLSPPGAPGLMGGYPNPNPPYGPPRNF